MSKITSWIGHLKEKRAAARILLNKYLIATLAFFVWILVIDNNNVSQWARTNRRLREQEAQIEELRHKAELNNRRIEELKTDKDTIETFARENYYFHEDSEVVYVVR